MKLGTLSGVLASPWLTVRAQILLGVLFVAASLPKIADPPSFAHMIYNYRLVPGAALNAMALVLPWLELLAGLALILGIWRRTAAILVGGLLLVFIVAISWNLVRGNPIVCGCFDVKAANLSSDEKFALMRLDVWRDLGMLALAVQIFFASKRDNPSAA